MENKKRAYQKAYRKKYNKRHKSVNVTLTLAEYQQLKSFATRQKTNPTALLKELAFAQLTNQSVYPNQLLTLLQEHNRLIRSIANNLNQIAYRANIFDEVDKKTVFDHLRTLHTQIEQFSKQQAFTSNQNSETNV